MTPASAYRLQFNRRFRFRDALRVVPYLHDLGISHVYASPIFRARRGSLHGYDIVDPTRFSRELGLARDFDAFVRELHRHAMGLILDIVPNHLAVSDENPWWLDVKRRGRTSPFARYFDIDWETGVHRRFFDIDHLIGVRVEDPDVFEATHALVFRLIREGKVQGLRIDHIDGLYDPAEYLARLRRRVGPHIHIIVEKILAGKERLRPWPVEGTVGYEHLNALNGIFVEPRGLKRFGPDLHRDGILKAKRRVVSDLLPKEMQDLAEATVRLPVYRTYARTARDRSGLPAPLRSRDLGLVRRWQQYTGAVMAKGFEDTVLYRHNRLVSLNEVGSGCRAVSVREFHRVNRELRGSLFPLSTHDTKRSGDVRARIHVLSEMPVEWLRLLREWNRDAPDRSLGSLLFQTLIGAWPVSRRRLTEYMRKAAREAKTRTDWRKPDLRFEKDLLDFVDSALRRDFQAFQKRVAFFGEINSLAQVLLCIASPGIPDIYQGNERPVFSLVDPDNRRPVDFGSLVTRRRRSRKYHVTREALRFRRENADLFLRGDYLPLEATGVGRRHIVAFARRRGRKWAVAVAPRLLAGLVSAGRPPLGGGVWGNSRLVLPKGAPVRWRNVLTGEVVEGIPDLASILRSFPVALLTSIAPLQPGR